MELFGTEVDKISRFDYLTGEVIEDIAYICDGNLRKNLAELPKKNAWMAPCARAQKMAK